LPEALGKANEGYMPPSAGIKALLPQTCFVHFRRKCAFQFKKAIARARRRKKSTTSDRFGFSDIMRLILRAKQIDGCALKVGSMYWPITNPCDGYYTTREKICKVLFLTFFW